MSGRRPLRLMNPGPVTLSARVRGALLGDDLCHREEEFATLQADVRERLVRVYSSGRDRYTSILLTGSGTTAVEAMIGSLVPSGAGKVLVASNGIYGERIISMLEALGRNYIVVRSAWTEAIDLARVHETLTRDRAITHVLAVHHETTTGRLNDLAALGAMCGRHGVPLLVDAVSSFGGEEIDLDAWHIEACAATANKCLHGAPGVSFVVVRRDVLEGNGSPAPSVSLDLRRHLAEQDAGRPLFTPAVQILYALREALIELEETGGWKRRRARYSTMSRALRQGLRGMGVRLLLESEDAYASSLTSFVLPTGRSYDELHDHLKRRGYVIYAGQQSFKAVMFRIAVMGDLSMEDIDEVLVAFRELPALDDLVPAAIRAFA